MEQLIEFWSDIRNVENASAEDMQKDILAYLRRLAGAQEDLKCWQDGATDASRSYGAKWKEKALVARNERDRLRKALEEAQKVSYLETLRDDLHNKLLLLTVDMEYVKGDLWDRMKVKYDAWAEVWESIGEALKGIKEEVES